MPYNTRRKSLSLPSLGIHVPVTHAARAAAASRSAQTASSASTAASAPPSSSTTSATMARPAPKEESNSQHPNKKVKRAHSESSDAVMRSPPPPPKKRDDAAVKFEHTPPPSPPPVDRASVEMTDADAPVRKIDLEGINDEIVEAVIVQLQNTGNRPHLVKELAAVLMQQLKIVQQSANPCAIVSSRLSTYLKRSGWSALAPCPLAKELETVHPRRTSFYLTTCPHQPLPSPAHAAALSQLAHSRTIITPSLSSAASTSAISDDAADSARRRELSPSPEVDLSSPELDDMDDDVAMPSTPIGGNGALLSLHGFGLGRLHLDGGCGTSTPSRHPHRAASPPLEKDEKEFTQTADGLQKRKMSGELMSAGSANNSSLDIDFGGRDDSGLFGMGAGENKAMLLGVPANTATLVPAPPTTFVTSPAIRPALFTLNLGKRDGGDGDGWAKLDSMLEWDRSPENIALEELDGLLDDF